MTNRRWFTAGALAVSLVVLGAIVAKAVRNNPGALYVLGNTATNMGYYDAADRFYRRSIWLDNSNCAARLGLAWTLHVRGRSAQAEAELKTAERIAVGPVRDLVRDTRTAIEYDLARRALGH